MSCSSPSHGCLRASPREPTSRPRRVQVSDDRLRDLTRVEGRGQAHRRAEPGELPLLSGREMEGGRHPPSPGHRRGIRGTAITPNRPRLIRSEVVASYSGTRASVRPNADFQHPTTAARGRPSAVPHQVLAERWRDFYIVAGTAAATLVGLLFVGLSPPSSVLPRVEVRSLARVPWRIRLPSLRLAVSWSFIRIRQRSARNSSEQEY
jgi:hypothetical protein